VLLAARGPRMTLRCHIAALHVSVFWFCVVRVFLLLFLFGWGVEPYPLLLRPRNGLFYQPRMTFDDECGAVGGMLGRKKRSSLRKLPHCRFVRHKSHMARPGLVPGRRGGKPATNRLSYGTAEGGNGIEAD
jgi:hypothetical protein